MFRDKLYYKNIVSILFFLFLFSCNQATETRIEDYIEVKVIDIKQTNSQIGLTLIDKNDSIMFGNLSKKNLENFDSIISRLNKNDKLKIKGILNDFNENQNKNSKKSSIIIINDLVFIE
ncbi:hypothetical protein [Flavobacterium sp. CS20]|uniref:hypothetical protein n=1 Tax=Flavobacterium sp. CS20 TaxID=2775246 RepID=UPI001B3A70E3|nr:hypothetical protein [Flavobacterium sp. CS20]QTY27803.1 hypothetical protein IGB25_04590 [Flavobacterium sp. CS20]